MMVNSFVQQVSIMFDSEHNIGNITNCVNFEIVRRFVQNIIEE